MPGNKKQNFWIILVVVMTILVTFFSLFFRAKTTKTSFEAKPYLVEVITTQREDEPIVVKAFGTVLPDSTVMLRAEVNGRVIERSPQLDVGGIVKKGEMLLRIDPRDYLISVEQEKAAVEHALFELQLEKGRQIIAKREWEELTSSIKTTELSEELALRKPHLKEKEAALTAAESRLEKAKLDLKRTVISSPLDAIVTKANVEVGDYVTPQNEIATLVATNNFSIKVSVPLSRLQWITFPQKNKSGSRAKIIQDLGNFSVVREGEVSRLLGDLDPSGRMARIIVNVNDPLSLQDSAYRDFPLLLGTYVQVEIEGPPLTNVFILPREALREDNKVWVKNAQNQLESRNVNILQKRENAVIVNEGIDEGEEIIISNIPLPIPGMELRTQKQESDR